MGVRWTALSLLPALLVIAPAPRALAQGQEQFVSFWTLCADGAIQVELSIESQEPWTENWAGTRLYRRCLTDCRSGTVLLTPEPIPRTTTQPLSSSHVDTEIDPSATYAYGYELVDAQGLVLDPEGNAALVVARPYASCGELLLGHGRIELEGDRARIAEPCEPDCAVSFVPGDIQLDCPLFHQGGIREGDVVVLFGTASFEVDWWNVRATLCGLADCPAVGAPESSWGTLKARH